MTAPLLNDIPFPEYEGDENKVIQIYLSAWISIQNEIMKLLKMQPTDNVVTLLQQQQRSLDRIEYLFNQLGVDLSKAVSPLLFDAIVTGAAYSVITKGVELQRVDYKTYNRSLTQIKKRIQYDYAPSRNYRTKKLITDTQQDLLKATTNTKENVKRLIRSTVAEVMQQNATRNQKFTNLEEKVKDSLRKNMLKEKLADADIAIVDRIGRQWKLETYVKMVVRTKTSTAYFDGIREQAEKEGMDLAVINTHPDTKDACLNYQGMVISLNGLTPGFPTYQELKSSKKIFHPNCRHFARPIPSMDWLPADSKAIHQKRITEYRKTLLK